MSQPIGEIMTDERVLADQEHPLVAETAKRLTEGKDQLVDQLESLFLFVRDHIVFEFPLSFSDWDTVRASRVIEMGTGYCNTKATVMVALCRARDIPVRVHYGMISVDIMRGVFPAFAFPFLPKSGPHSWTEVKIDGVWKSIDSYINDEALFKGSMARLERSGRTMGYSLSRIDGRCSCEFNFGEKGFVHMGAVLEDLGAWNDASEFFSTEHYRTFSGFQQLIYPVMAVLSNRNIRRIRAH
jgi:hypothetical protein